MNERMEGLQGWMAEIERKQDRMLKIGGGAAILAVLLSGGALALGIINQQNASSKDDVDDLTGQVNELGASIKTDTEDQLKTINGRIDAIEQQVKTIQQTQTTQTQDIATLKQQQQAAASAAGGRCRGRHRRRPRRPARRHAPRRPGPGRQPLGTAAPSAA